MIIRLFNALLAVNATILWHTSFSNQTLSSLIMSGIMGCILGFSIISAVLGAVEYSLSKSRKAQK